MDFTTIVGIPLGILLIIFCIIIDGNPLSIYISNPVAAMITVGGSFCSVMISYKFKHLRKISSYLKMSIRQKKSNTDSLIANLILYSEKSRQNGLLSLEEELDNITDKFTKKGLQLIIDGTDPEIIKNILNNQINRMNQRHEIGINLFNDWAKLAPAFGMIGTLYGLIGMLLSMADPSQIGKGMSVALITTFYGAVLANLILIPIKNKLSLNDEEETLEKEIIMEGILSIQSGDNPVILKEKLESFLSCS